MAIRSTLRETSPTDCTPPALSLAFTVAAKSAADELRPSDRLAQTGAEKRRSQAPVNVVPSLVLESESVAGVSAERFIAAFASQHYRNAFTRKPRYEVQGHARRPCDRLIFMPN